jgi:hypothetical protein
MHQRWGKREAGEGGIFDGAEVFMRMVESSRGPARLIYKIIDNIRDVTIFDWKRRSRLISRLEMLRCRADLT